VVACEPIWQNVQAYRTVASNPCPHIDIEPLLVSTQYFFSFNSQIKRFRKHGDMDSFSCFGSGSGTGSTQPREDN
jgi:hypothetical protein